MRSYHSNGKLMGEIPFKNNEVDGIGKMYDTKDKKLLTTIDAQNNNYISGKCHNSKTLTGEEISTLETSETSAAFFRFLHEICLPNL